MRSRSSVRWAFVATGSLLGVASGCTRGPDVASAPPAPVTATAATSATTNTTTSTTTVAPTTSTTSTTTTSTSTTTTTTTTTTTSTTTTTTTSTPTTPDRRGSITDIRPPSDIPTPALGPDWTTQVIGTSVLGLDIVAFVHSVDAPRRSVLVIGGLHGNEPVTPPAVRGLLEASIPDDVTVWLVPEANPDGVLAGTRWNANGVDLNRNFGWDWRAEDGGPGPFSEPESQALATFIDTVRPGVVVWVHQPYGYAGSVGPTDRALEQAWSVATGLPTRSGVTQHGGGETWTAFAAGLPSMLIEIDTWNANPEMVAMQRAGFEALLASLD